MYILEIRKTPPIIHIDQGLCAVIRSANATEVARVKILESASSLSQNNSDLAQCR